MQRDKGGKVGADWRSKAEARLDPFFPPFPFLSSISLIFKKEGNAITVTVMVNQFKSYISKGEDTYVKVRRYTYVATLDLYSSFFTADFVEERTIYVLIP